MSRRLPLFLLSLLLSITIHAQTHIAAGLSMNMQPYENYDDNPRYMPGAEILVHGKHFGGHLSVEYADLSDFNALLVTHANVVYRHAFGSGWSVLAGAGPTWIDINDFGPEETTFNVEGEVAKRFGRVDVFARVRQYDFTFRDSRALASPNGAAVGLGVRFSLR